MGTVLRGGTLVELEPARVERADLRVDNGLIVGRGLDVAADPSDDVVDITGKLVLPGFVCAHHHLYASLLRGRPGTFDAREYPGGLEHGRWWLEPLLDLDAVQLSATVGALEALGAGTTTVVDHHASPAAVVGSLLRVARGVNEVGLRGVLAYQVTDRYGPEVRAAALEETVGFIRRAQGRFRGLVGGEASSELSEEALKGLADAVQATGAGLHIHLAEDVLDERLSTSRHGATPVARLSAAGLLSSQTVVAHAVHLAWPELSRVIGSGAWLVHNPQSNMQQQVGYAPAGKFGARASLGTDGLGGDIWTELRVAHFRAREAGQPIDPLRYLANGHRLASQAFGIPFGLFEPGAAADLQVLDYRPSTPLTAASLASHVLHGMGARWVESVMVDGIWRQWARRPLSVAPEVVAEQARQTAEALWAVAPAPPQG